jgi:Tfp pilus assembly protein PilV
MTLAEVLIALGILAISIGGILATLLQSRRLTERSVAEASALTIVQGYVEQMKNMELVQLTGKTDTKGNPVVNPASYAIPTLLDDTTPDNLMTSTGSPPALSSITAGVTPEGVVDNLRSFDMAKDAAATSSSSKDSESTTKTQMVSWSSVWPKARAFPTTTVGLVDLKLNLWVWVSDLSNTSTVQAQRVFGVTIIYTWQYRNGKNTKYAVGTVRTIRSAVPTF